MSDTPVITPPLVDPQLEFPNVEQVDPVLDLFKSNPYNYQPAHWSITPNEDGTVHFRNNMSQLELTGTVEQFNALLRGV